MGLKTRISNIITSVKGMSPKQRIKTLSASFVTRARLAAVYSDRKFHQVKGYLEQKTFELGYPSNEELKQLAPESVHNDYQELAESGDVYDPNANSKMVSEGYSQAPTITRNYYADSSPLKIPAAWADDQPVLKPNFKDRKKKIELSPDGYNSYYLHKYSRELQRNIANIHVQSHRQKRLFQLHSGVMGLIVLSLVCSSSSLALASGLILLLTHLLLQRLEARQIDKPLPEILLTHEQIHDQRKKFSPKSLKEPSDFDPYGIYGEHEALPTTSEFTIDTISATPGFVSNTWSQQTWGCPNPTSANDNADSI